MDPNNNLRDLRTNIQTALGLVYSEGTPKPKKVLNLLTEIAEDFDNLDDHLSKGGVVPDDWNARVKAGAVALMSAYPFLLEDFTPDFFHKMAERVLEAGL